MEFCLNPIYVVSLILLLITVVNPGSFLFHITFKGNPSALHSNTTLSPTSATTLDSLSGNRVRTVGKNEKQEPLAHTVAHVHAGKLRHHVWVTAA